MSIFTRRIETIIHILINTFIVSFFHDYKKDAIDVRFYELFTGIQVIRRKMDPTI